jgi:hypothetical protein
MVYATVIAWGATFARRATIFAVEGRDPMGLRLGVLAVALAAGAFSSAHATIILYADDRPGFLAATGATSIGPLPAAGGSGTTIGNVTFTNGAPPGSIVFGAWSNEISGNDLAVSGFENFNLSISGGGVYSLGFDFHEPLESPAAPPPGCNTQPVPCVDSPFLIEIFAGATSLGVFAYNAPNDTSTAMGGPLGFFGVHSDVLFDGVQVREQAPPGTNDNEYFGNFLTGTEALVAAVPEPGTLALFGVSLIGLAALRRRRGATALSLR